ncbi:DUF2933 domain-containing protein [Cohaesibacter sp. CAU 1516]|uniref:DUF2933 domain-containing protein n=1 Tax=Cohaesibacter sp. CAU 1516 TaxID=2576038 RepID=UPI0010FECD09|nr:DUF2933 domain-containing protein [Cohaesibacter sp. CAU 1516]TLP42296.1 DUF2933 domain-containing protein [Cohaesibacter sp. CAU 1516]
MTNENEQTVRPSFLSRLIPRTGHGSMMAICCTLMLVTAASILVAPADETTAGNSLFALLPIAGCLVMHLFMHRMMGGHHNHAKHKASRQGPSEQQPRAKAFGREHT